MANRYFEPGEGRAAKVNALFSGIARRYDLLNDLQSFGLHRWWKRRVIELASVAPGARALDVCCGTGDLAIGLARRGAEVVGVDFSAAMLDVAKGRNSRAQFILADALRIPFQDATFDIVTVGYGLRNLASWELGLSEMARVARGGGRLLALEFGKPENALWRAIYLGYLRIVLPCLGRLFCRDAEAYAYILESLKHYPAQEGVASKMRVLGLGNVRVVRLMGGVMTINYGEKTAG
jgi:demethylmenaquinone methyltransferase/2-methoxy-6-polyprenyl-1,4-benzoquinol methylase